MGSSSQTATICFLNTSRSSSSAEQGYAISKFVSTLGCRMPSVPMEMSVGEEVDEGRMDDNAALTPLVFLAGSLGR